MRGRRWIGLGAALLLALGLLSAPALAAAPAPAPGGELPPAASEGDGQPSADSENALLSGIGLSRSALTLAVGSSAALTVHALPEGAPAPAVTWSSSDEGVAAVDAGGLVTAVGAGQATVTARTLTGGFAASCTVTVTAKTGAEDVYPPVVGKTQGGSATAFPAQPRQGDVVTISAVPDPGYEVGQISAVSQSGQTVPLDRHRDGSWTFHQPDSRVWVTVTFQRKPWTNPFSDVSQGDWYYDSVALVCQAGVMEGTGRGFEPAAAVTRGTLATILARLDGTDTAGGGTWYEKGMAWAVAHGVSDGTAPESVLTREQAAAMLYRDAGSPGLSGTAALDRFPDGDRVSPWARTAMSWAVEEGLLQGGDHGLAPQGQLTRGELAAILSRYLTKA